MPDNLQVIDFKSLREYLLSVNGFYRLAQRTTAGAWTSPPDSERRQSPSMTFVNHKHFILPALIALFNATRRGMLRASPFRNG